MMFIHVSLCTSARLSLGSHLKVEPLVKGWLSIPYHELSSEVTEPSALTWAMDSFLHLHHHSDLLHFLLLLCVIIYGYFSIAF